MRKSLWMITLVLLVTALGSTPAHADGVDVFNGGGQITAIDGITLNGSLYNVTFSSTIDNTFSAYAYNSSTIMGIYTAIDSDLGTAKIVDSQGLVYAIAASAGFDTEQCYLVNAGCNAGWVFLDVNTQTSTEATVISYPVEYFWANFSPAVVATPEPGAATLTLTGVGLLGLMVVMRKRIALGLR